MLSFFGLGWRYKLQKKRNNYLLSLANEIVLGNALKSGDDLYYFLVDYLGRNAVLVLLDGKGLDETQEVKIPLKTFIVKK